MGKTTIEWTDFSWNAWEGCTKVSPGCLHCYAETRNHRFGGDNWGPGKPRRRTSASNWKLPVKWHREAFIDACHDCDPCLGGRPDQCAVSRQRRPRVFCASLADWLDDEVPIEWLADLLNLIHDTPNLDWLLLTKRPENWIARIEGASRVLGTTVSDARSLAGEWIRLWRNNEAPANVWMGTSVEDQQRADERIPELLKIPAKIRFLSVEPMLGPINLASFRNAQNIVLGTGWLGRGTIDWCIFGGESGPNARPCNVGWIRDGVRQCRAAGVAPFVKQLGRFAVAEHEVGTAKGGCLMPLKLNDKKGGDPAEWPVDLRVREFPV